MNNTQTNITIHTMDQKSPEWFKAKALVISGTESDALLGTPKARQTLVYKKIAERLCTEREDLKYLSAMQRGNYLESEARAYYMSHPDTGTVRQCGLVTNDNGQGFSPDGLSHLENPVYAVEIKSPQGTNYIRYAIEGLQAFLDDYQAQASRPFQLFPTLEYVECVVYNPECMSCPMVKFTYTRAMADSTLAQLEKNEPEVQQKIADGVEHMGKLAKEFNHYTN